MVRDLGVRKCFEESKDNKQLLPGFYSVYIMSTHGNHGRGSSGPKSLSGTTKGTQSCGLSEICWRDEGTKDLKTINVYDLNEENGDI